VAPHLAGGTPVEEGGEPAAHPLIEVQAWTQSL
jgi:hypothetical protein